jgi:hypothetical protein
MGPNPDWGKIQDENLLANPRVTSNLEPPRHVDIHPRLDNHALANLCAEDSQQSAF